ncbi:DinB family protein [Planctomonas sp. JC2975]|uniref:DinB family protein n=1 Tax=Planctomonas sp. JC2975 TaxID=2729626 RepID=UPI001475D334|nr:DinB family protein [Planctomonas sp. JC2975]NNC10589.1 DinB family protein [Planctomonas sp. JC2975]
MTHDERAEKAFLTRYLQESRDALVWKLDGLGEREARLPMTPTGTNLLGLVKHVASMEYGYFGEVFGRDPGVPMPWLEAGAEDNADMWATAEESIDWVREFYVGAQSFGDRTIAELELDSPGIVPWWSPERRDVTLRQIIVHLIDETAHHAGHADIVRELVDGSVGLRPAVSNLPDHDAQWWAAYRARLQAVADAFGG